MSANQQLMASFKRPPYTEYDTFSSFGFVSGHSSGTWSSNYLAQSGSPSSAIGRLGLGKSSGKWYFECTTSGATHIGLAQATFPMNTYLGYVTASIGWAGLTIYDRGSSSSYGSVPADGSVIGVALDMDAGTLTLYKNNVSMGVAATGLTGTWYGAAMAYSGPSGSISLNTGPTTAYSPPAGHSLLSTYYP